MSRIVSRTCTEVPDDGRDREPNSRPLDTYRAAPAYVLLGDPGAGKTTALERECEACGADGVFEPVRNFLTFSPRNHPEWRGKTLFLDGLDEVRAGSSDPRRRFDAIRSHLDELGRPRFRLSCREADWLGTKDRLRMAAVAPGRSLTVLRLDPLTESDVEEIVESDRRFSNSLERLEFIQKARDRGLEGFLTNPQTLDMLSDVVRGGKWPASRLGLFEQACERMAGECNGEHLTSSRLDDVLAAAGRLCAIQLIAGVAGYAITSDQKSKDFPALDQCEADWALVPASSPGRASQSDLLRAACGTKLFRAASDGRFTPVHRHVAEFLGARYLARLIRGGQAGQGLPARRVLALITGSDGIVVSELRGLSAWLAAHCGSTRHYLIERDPTALGLYGVVSRFSTEEKRDILESLRREERQAPGLFSRDWTGTAWGPLAGPTMEPTFREILTDSRLKNRPSFARFVLRILAHGSGLPSLSSPLLDIVRDSTWPPDVNSAALNAFRLNHPNGQEKTITLGRLLVDIRYERVQDPDNHLLGDLLTNLYPDELSPSDVWEYFYAPREFTLEGSHEDFWKQMVAVQDFTVLNAYKNFWKQTVARQCSDPHVAEHLDALALRLDAIGMVFRELSVEDVPAHLLARGLEAYGEEIETKRLYEWLGVGLVSTDRADPATGDALRRIRSWLEQHPEAQKSIIAEGLGHASFGFGEARLPVNDVRHRLYGCKRPADFGLWCLQMIEGSESRIAQLLLAYAFDAVAKNEGDEGLSVEVLIDYTRAHPALADALAELGVCHLDEVYFSNQEHTRNVRRRRERERYRRQTLIDLVRSHEEALRENRGPPYLLQQIAEGYFGLLAEAEGTDPLARLGSLFEDDERLVETALVALRGAVDRGDMPEADEIIDLRRKGQEHGLALPFRAALAERARSAQGALLDFDCGEMEIALAFRYCTVNFMYYYCDRDVPHGPPAWYRRLLEVKPGLVADVMMRCATSALREGQTEALCLKELAHSGACATVARIVILSILRSFPVRCPARQMRDLGRLLWTALHYADRESFLELIDIKLSRTSMCVAQRVRWTTAGFLLSSGNRPEYAKALKGSSERRLREVANFLGVAGDAADWIDRLKAKELEVLVRLFGAYFGHGRWPSGQTASSLICPELEFLDPMVGMIERLRESRCDDARAALESLASDESLVKWRDELVDARYERRVRDREAYLHPDIGQVCRTLKGGPPANAGDLATLVGDRLDEIGRRIRTGNDNGWRPYWNEDEHRRPVQPKHEGSCRDALLGELRHHLGDAADAQPEGRYANDKRADIRVARGDFQVPVEIKKNSHPELWSALRSQLIARYTIDPATGGYGIYLVLWFGKDAGRGKPQPASRPRPDGPRALKARLEGDLTPDEAHRISVCVIDVSAPPSVAAATTDRTASGSAP